MLENEIIDKNQFGFLPGKSTHEAIFKTVQQIYSAINSKKLLGMILLDVAKAFNCIDHDILFIKMEKAGFSQNLINWFKSYLTRSQRVNMDNNFSEVVPVLKGIAQGTVLRPILFIFYINDIFKSSKFVKMSLKKIRKYLTFGAAVTVYKQTILPIFDYAGFMLISCRKEEKGDFQILQNDILRICNLSRISDRVSITELHAKCKIISLEQRMRIQLLWLMYLLSRDETFLKVPNRVTRSIDKIVFKVPTKILLIYERSPYYIGTKLWNELNRTTQDSPDVFAFKKELRRMNRVYVKL